MLWLIFVIVGALMLIGMLLLIVKAARKLAAEHKASLERIGPPTEHTLAQKEWMSIRRMASGMPAAHAFTNSHTKHHIPRTPPGSPRLYLTGQSGRWMSGSDARSRGLGATSAVSARSVWDIAASGHRDGAQSPEVLDYDPTLGTNGAEQQQQQSSWFNPFGPAQQ